MRHCPNTSHNEPYAPTIKTHPHNFYLRKKKPILITASRKFYSTLSYVLLMSNFPYNASSMLRMQSFICSQSQSIISDQPSLDKGTLIRRNYAGGAFQSIDNTLETILYSTLQRRTSLNFSLGRVFYFGNKRNFGRIYLLIKMA